MAIDQNGILSISNLGDSAPLLTSECMSYTTPLFITGASPGPGVPKTLSQSKIFGKIKKNKHISNNSHSHLTIFWQLEKLIVFWNNFWEFLEML